MTIGIQLLREIDKYFAARQYDKAITLLDKTVRENPGENSLKLKLADAYYLYGKNAEAIATLKEVTIEFARYGFITKAMAVQKKMQRIDPAAAVEVDIYQYIEDGEDPGDLMPAGPDANAAGAGQKEAADDASFKALDSLFKGLTKEEFAQILKRLDELTVPAGEVVFREGDKDESVYIIISGAVQILVIHNEKEVELAVLKEGDFFGEVALLTGKARTATVRCIDGSTFLVLSRENFQSLNEKYPSIQETLLEALELRAQGTVDKLMEVDLEGM